MKLPEYKKLEAYAKELYKEADQVILNNLKEVLK